MLSRQAPAAAAIAAVASAAAVTAFLVKRRGVASQLEDEEPPNENTVDCAQHQRRMTLEESLKDGDLTVKPIGTVRSIYRLCVGTPRQGLLAPNARGRLELDGVSHDAVLELDGFSHVWVIFVFHLNTVSKNNGVPSKIAPPALGGKKVGVLATRSPHRVNPIGMTLCKLDSITLPTKGSPKTILNVSGLDLVDGTPILDLKPYVPNYDSVPSDQVHLPPWVSGGLATRRPVHIQPKALEELQVILSEQPNALDFYGTHCGDGSMDETMESITHCIAEVLSIDVRSVWQTNKARDSKFQAERAGRVKDVLSEKTGPTKDSEQCTQQLDNLLIYYTVQAPEQHARNTSEGSGAEDVVHVNSIQLLTCEKPMTNRLREVREAIDAASPVIVSGAEQLKETIAIDVAFATTVAGAEPLKETIAVAAVSSVPVEGDEQQKRTVATGDEQLKETIAIAVASATTVAGDEPSKETIAVAAASSVTVEGDEQQKRTVAANVSPTNVPPTDADYKSLKNYWGKVAARNTPTGLLPEEKGRQSSEKFFVFSDKPVIPVRPAAKAGALVHPVADGEISSVDLLSTDEAKMAPRGAKAGAPVHPDVVNEIPTVVPPRPVVESSEHESGVDDDDELDDKTGTPTVVLPFPVVESKEQVSTVGDDEMDNKTSVPTAVPLLLPVVERNEQNSIIGER